MSDGDDSRLRTLDAYLERFLNYPAVLECPEMWIETCTLGKKCFVGSGEIRMRSPSHFEYVFHGKKTDIDNFVSRIRRAREREYDVHAQFRLCGVDYQGVDWNAGYVNLNIGHATKNGYFRITGSCNGLSAGASGPHVAERSSIEVIYDRSLRLPIPLNMVTKIERGGRDVFWSRRYGTQSVAVAGTAVEFFHDAQREAIWATAETSEDFPHPYAENWISEPLRILLGEQVYPRLVARNFGGQRANIWVRPAPGRDAQSLVASILESDPFFAADDFWSMYRQILTMITKARGVKGNRNFEAHPLTQYYDEIIQSTSGSNWVACLTLASAIEGIAKGMLTDSETRSHYPIEDIESLRSHVSSWSGDLNLKSRALASIDANKTKGIASALRFMVTDNVVTKEHIDTWLAVRNQVMHGSLVPPWSDQELDQKILKLVELMHRVSKIYVQRNAFPSG